MDLKMAVIHNIAYGISEKVFLKLKFTFYICHTLCDLTNLIRIRGSVPKPNKLPVGAFHRLFYEYYGPLPLY